LAADAQLTPNVSGAAELTYDLADIHSDHYDTCAIAELKASLTSGLTPRQELCNLCLP
jgi:hypothetical protein